MASKKGDRKKRKNGNGSKKRYQTMMGDENFAFVAGYTSWGFPYGATWEEMEKLERERQDSVNQNTFVIEELPFD